MAKGPKQEVNELEKSADLERDLEDEGFNDDQTRDFIKTQKSQIKDLQEKLEASKKQYKADRAEVESLRLKDPEQYRQ